MDKSRRPILHLLCELKRVLCYHPLKIIITQVFQMQVIATLLLSSIVLCNHVESGGTPTVLYVTPNTNIPCPEMPCLTLSQYAQDQDAYFGTDTELHFLSGAHSLTNPIVIEGHTNSTKLALVGKVLDQSEIVIITGGQVSLKLVEMESIRIESMHFSGMNIFIGNSRLAVKELQLYYTAVMNGSVFIFESIDNITGTNITISNSSDAYSAGVIRLSTVVFTNMTVENNSGDSILIIEESFVQFKGISIFANNSAIKGSTLVITISTAIFNGSILFQSNRCKNQGGAMNIVSSKVMFTDEIELNGNSAQDGGAIQLDHSALELRGLIVFSTNWVTEKAFTGKVLGGAINSIQSNITMIGTVTFISNRIHALLLVGFGGAISAQMSRITLSGTINFHHNTAGGLLNFGGAILLSNSTFVATNAVLTFTNNSAQNGGAIAITGLLQLMSLNPLPSTIKVEGTSLFDANVATLVGAALYGDDQIMYILFSGNTTLSEYGNQKPCSSQIFILQTTMSDIQFHGYTEIKQSCSTGMIVVFRGNVYVLFSGITKFVNNTSAVGGFQVMDNASVNFFGQIYFKGNHGGTSGIIALKDSRPSVIIGEVLFSDNNSGISLLNSELKLEGDFNITHSVGPQYGCITVAFGSTVTINGSMLINSNIANTVPAIYSYNSSIKMYGDYNFTNINAIGYGGVVFSLGSTIYLYGYISFISNSASSRGGAICTLYSELFLSGNHVYSNNSALPSAGGVISLEMFSVIHFNDLAVTCDNNRAEKGAIFYHDDVLNAIDCLDNTGLPFLIKSLSVQSECFFSKLNNVNVTNTGNNIASDIGNVIFGGNLKRCNQVYAAKTFIDLFHTDDSIQNITSNPYQIVFCKNDKPVISTRLGISSNMIIDKIPGKSFSVSIAGLNQLLKPISSTIRAEISESNYTARLGSFQINQLTKHSCTKLNYRIFTQATNVHLTLYAEGPCNKLGTTAITIKAKFGSCPDGFELVQNECVCEADLFKYTTMCNIDDESILNGGNFWAGELYGSNGSYIGRVSFPNCPFDYCAKETVNSTLKNPDEQCAHKRSGTICGQCIANFSLTLGEVQCSDCSKTNPAVTLGLLLLFALIGIILVILLIVLKMTVASGTLNGLIFYANIIDANGNIFIPQGGWLRVFISWLNLDFGFTTCFYRGMDMYGYTWLQFLFPFYIWILIGILIVISRRSAWVTKMVGSNPVAVLATLILLSYVKLLRTVTTVFYFATLQFPHGQTSTVWLYDGNIPYLQGKHLALFIFALLFFILLFLPYNFLLVVGPWLQNISGERLDESKFKASVRKILLGCFEDYRIKSFVDTYTVAYNPGCQYWTGVFLILRFILFLVFATSAFRNSSATLMAVTTSLLAVTTVTRVFTGRIYKNWCVDILEALFLLNLGILSVATFHNMMTGGNQQLVADISGGTSLILFLLIVACHAVKQTYSTHSFGVIYMKLKRKFHPGKDHNDQQAQLLSHIIDNPQEVAPMTTVISFPSI